MSGERIYLFDTTLRDGAQTQGVDFTTADKVAITKSLDALGIDYIEGGWPGANPTDDAFFADPPALDGATLVAFGMTRRDGRSAENDPGLASLVNSKAGAICLVGKAWDFHVDVVLGISNEENLAMIADSVAFAKARKGEAMYDAEHFFDGYKANPDFALACVTGALEAGARWIILCDTNGGTLPDEVERIVKEVARHVPGDQLGIHAHNDTENAVANSLAAVRAGARQVQGTLNGLGERCGNANLISLIPTLTLKMRCETGVDEGRLKHLTQISNMLNERLNRGANRHAAYVGASAFAHKGGLHVSAVEKDPRTYEHIDPSLVGNRRSVLVSDQAGRSNILARFREIGIEVDGKDRRVARLVELVKERESQGYAYDGSEASFELLARRMLGQIPDYFELKRFRVMDERRLNARGELVTESEATVTLAVGGKDVMTVANGNGPINALDSALKKALLPIYPIVEDMHLLDFKVRIMPPSANTSGTDAVTRVMIETADGNGTRWSTLGVSPNIIDASFGALFDSISYRLYQAGVKAA
jgi:2-isopropylmalate synthase